MNTTREKIADGAMAAVGAGLLTGSTAINPYLQMAVYALSIAAGLVATACYLRR